MDEVTIVGSRCGPFDRALDAVSRGEEDWTEPLKKFWKPFISQVDHIEKNVSREEVAQARELGKDPVSGKPVTVRMGRYGPFVQIGTKDDEEKPKFAGLRPGQKMDLIKLPEALELFKLPRKLGQTAEGEPVEANIGRFGPYIKYGAKYVSLKPPDDPYTVEIEFLDVLDLVPQSGVRVADFSVHAAGPFAEVSARMQATLAGARSTIGMPNPSNREG